MNKTTKGALAAGTAALLLIGGAGTLAYWSDNGTANGGQFNSGSLALSDGTCGPNWTYAGPNAGSGLGANGDTVNNIAPGDTITKDCTFTVTAVGDNLSAIVTAPDSLTYDATGNTAASLDLTVDATYDLGGSPLADGAEITEAADGQTLTVTFDVTFPSGTAENATTPVNINDTQGLQVALDDLDVTLTQTH